MCLENFMDVSLFGGGKKDFHTRCSFYRFRMLSLICFWSEWVGKLHRERYLNGDKKQNFFLYFSKIHLPNILNLGSLAHYSHLEMWRQASKEMVFLGRDLKMTSMLELLTFMKSHALKHRLWTHSMGIPMAQLVFRFEWRESDLVCSLITN